MRYVIIPIAIFLGIVIPSLSTPKCPKPIIIKNGKKASIGDLTEQERFAYNGAIVRCGFLYGNRSPCLYKFIVEEPQRYIAKCSEEIGK